MAALHISTSDSIAQPAERAADADQDPFGNTDAVVWNLRKKVFDLDISIVSLPSDLVR